MDQVADCCCRGDIAALEKVSDGMKPELLHSACHQGRVTSLTLAVKSGHLPVVEFLWSRGAEQYLRDKASCLTLAISSGHLYMVEFLLRTGADLYLFDKVKFAIYLEKNINNTFSKDGRSGFLLRDSESVSEDIRALLSNTHQVRSSFTVETTVFTLL